MELGQLFYNHEGKDSEADTIMLSNQPQTPDSVICRKAKFYLLKPLQSNAFLTNRVVTENGVQRGDVASQGHTIRLQAELGWNLTPLLMQNTCRATVLPRMAPLAIVPASPMG